MTPREKQLLFALQSAWPYVHQWCTIQSVRNEVSQALFGRDARDASRTRIDSQDVAEWKERIKADPEVGYRLMRDAGIWDKHNKLTAKFGGNGGCAAYTDGQHRWDILGNCMGADCYAEKPE